MPKKPSKPTPPASGAETPKEKTVSRKSASPKREGRAAAKPPSRAAAVEKVSTPTRAKTALPKTLPPPTQEEIALCAYFISQEKRSLGLPSDPAQDWIEAESRLASDRKGGKRARSSENRSE